MRDLLLTDETRLMAEGAGIATHAFRAHILKRVAEKPNAPWHYAGLIAGLLLAAKAEGTDPDDVLANAQTIFERQTKVVPLRRTPTAGVPAQPGPEAA